MLLSTFKMLLQTRRCFSSIQIFTFQFNPDIYRIITSSQPPPLATCTILRVATAKPTTWKLSSRCQAKMKIYTRGCSPVLKLQLAGVTKCGEWEVQVFGGWAEGRTNGRKQGAGGGINWREGLAGFFNLFQNWFNSNSPDNVFHSQLNAEIEDHLSAIST